MNKIKLQKLGWIIVKPDGKSYNDKTGFPFIYITKRGARSALSNNWDICKRHNIPIEDCQVIEINVSYEYELPAKKEKEKLTNRKFSAHIKSESGDDYYIQFTADKMPQTDAEWMKVFLNDPNLSVADAWDENFNGPGVAGTWLHVKSCMEIL